MNGKFSLAPLGISVGAPTVGRVVLANESAFNNTFYSQPLTDFAVGYRNEEEDLQGMLDFIAPPVQATRKFQYGVMSNKAAFEAITDGSDERALQGEFKTVQAYDSIADGHTNSKGLTTLIDNDELEEVPGKLEEKIAWLKQLLLRADLLRANALLASLATNTNKTWSSGTPQPDVDVKKAVRAYRTACGVQPNKVLFGGGAWDLRDQALSGTNTAGGFAGLMRLEDGLARFVRVREIMVNELVYELPSGKTPIITDNKVYIFEGQRMPSTRDASNVKRFWSPVMGGGEYAVFVDKTTMAELTKVTVFHRSAIVSPNTLGVQSLTIS